MLGELFPYHPTKLYVTTVKCDDFELPLQNAGVLKVLRKLLEAGRYLNDALGILSPYIVFIVIVTAADSQRFYPTMNSTANIVYP